MSASDMAMLVGVRIQGHEVIEAIAEANVAAAGAHDDAADLVALLAARTPPEA